MNGIKRFTRWLSFFILFILAFGQGCKDDYQSSIPTVDFMFTIHLVNHNNLTTVGFPEYLNGGYGGVVIVNNGLDGYYAYDVTCPYEVDLNCRVEGDGAIVTCPCCGTQYNLLENGFAFGGPSAEPLKSYNVNATGSDLIISD